jgi:hypothetical protein
VAPFTMNKVQKLNTIKDVQKYFHRLYLLSYALDLYAQR